MQKKKIDVILYAYKKPILKEMFMVNSIQKLRQEIHVQMEKEMAISKFSSMSDEGLIDVNRYSLFQKKCLPLDKSLFAWLLKDDLKWLQALLK